MLAVAERVRRCPPRRSRGVWPLSFGHSSGAGMAAYRLSRRTSIWNKPAEFARLAVDRFFQIVLCRVQSSRRDHYETDHAPTRLALALLEVHAACTVCDGDSKPTQSTLTANHVSRAIAWKHPDARRRIIHAVANALLRTIPGMALVVEVGLVESGLGQPLTCGSCFRRAFPPSPYARSHIDTPTPCLRRTRRLCRRQRLFLDLLDRADFVPLKRCRRPGGDCTGKPLGGRAQLQSHENLLRLLYFLSELSGEDRYAQAADRALKGIAAQTRPRGDGTPALGRAHVVGCAGRRRRGFGSSASPARAFPTMDVVGAVFCVGSEQPTSSRWGCGGSTSLIKVRAI